MQVLASLASFFPAEKIRTTIPPALYTASVGSKAKIMHYNNDNVELLREITNRLIISINRVGVKATRDSFEENVLLKNCIIDLLKKINANLNGFSYLLIHFSDASKCLIKIPIALCLRGALLDCMLGVYFYTFKSDEKSLLYELEVMNLDYAKFLKDTNEFSLKYGYDLTDSQLKNELDKWIIDFKNKNSKIFKTSDNLWNLKSSKEIRKDSKFDNSVNSDKDKFIWIEKLDKDKKYVSLYFLFRYFSQYQHYCLANRTMIDENPETDFIKQVASVASICQSIWAFAFCLNQIDDEFKSDFSIIGEKFERFLK
jgi:hypothetical protein